MTSTRERRDRGAGEFLLKHAGEWLIGLCHLLGATGLWLLFLWIDSPGPRAIVLMTAVAIALLGTVRILASAALPIPVGHGHRLAAAIAWITGASFYLLNGSSTAGIVFGWLLLIWGIAAAGSQSLGLFTHVAVMARLTRSSAAGIRPALPMALVYFHAEPGFGVFYGQRLAVKTAHAIEKLRGEKMVYPLVSDSLRRRSLDFRRYVAQHASALVVVTVPGGPKLPEFDQETRDLIQVTRGEVFLVEVSFGDRHASTDELMREVTRLTVRPDLLTRTREAKASASLADSLASTIFPLTRSDALLPDHLYRAQIDLARSGLPILARPYLRFRLARSDSERFSSLLDLFEALSRLSVAVQLVHRFNTDFEGASKIAKKLIRPTWGKWAEVLRDLCAIGGGSHPLASRVTDVWRGVPGEMPLNVVTNAQQVGLQSPEREDPVSLLDWLDWLVYLRNITRGHGSVNEERVAPLLDGLHAAFLDLVDRLAPMAIQAEITIVTPSGPQVVARGWYRDPVLPSSPEALLPVLLDAPAAPRLLLSPLVVRLGRADLMWNAVRDERVEYLDYATGSMHYDTALAGKAIADMWRDSSRACGQLVTA